MNKTAIKNFAVWARKELIEKSTQRAKIYGIEKDKEIYRYWSLFKKNLKKENLYIERKE